MSDKIGRNDPCPCGSGKKYKACCLLKQEQKMTSLKGRKFTAKVLSSGGMSKQKEESQPDPEQVKAALDYNRLMERSFGEALTSKEEKPDLVSKDADFEPEEKKGE